jgi:uncharacterized protein YkwD
MVATMNLLIMFSLAMPCPTCSIDYPAEIKESHSEQNRIRHMYGYDPLRFDRGLQVRAQRHAEWMAATGRYEHSGEVAEIIFKGPTNARDAFNGYLYSPPHFSVMLSGTRAGHGHAVRNGVHWWVTIVSSEGGVK